MSLQDPILSPELLPSLPTPVIVDTRPGATGLAGYYAARVAGAIHLDLDRHLAASVTDPARGGRHPLPDPAGFCALLAQTGLTPDREVVLYDDKGGAMAAARLWWMLRALGFERVRVLDGGLQAAQKAGLALATGDAEPTPAHGSAGTSSVRVTAAELEHQLFPSGFDGLPTANIDEVARAVADPNRVVMDVREAARYRGEVEPIDPVAGHIPGAVNVPYTENLSSDGRFKSATALRGLYRALLEGAQPQQGEAMAPALSSELGCIVHCGSGVTACHTILALNRAGFTEAALYVGSWSEWCRQPTAPLARV